ncbi:MAG: 30S ribosomal protein S16 [Deltaproteobacteria bacterium]|nr:30S ribosomal protein S16 [Deltaproteobacteria bacterium]
MLTLRLSRAGTKKKPVYHLIATDSRSRRDGRFIENLGYYNPLRKVLVLKDDRVQHWLKLGASLSETAKQLIQRHTRHQGFGVAPAVPAGRAAPTATAAATVAPAPATNVVVVQMPEASTPTAS